MDEKTGVWSPIDPDLPMKTFAAYEADIFRFALEKAGGNVSLAAKLLQVGRATVYRKMREYRISRASLGKTDMPALLHMAISQDTST